MRLADLIGTFPMDGDTMKALVDFDESLRQQRKHICERAFALFPDLDLKSPSYAAYLRTLMLNDYREYGEDPMKPYLVVPLFSVKR